MILLLLLACPPSGSKDTGPAGGVACGDTLTCGASEVCMTDRYPAACEDRADTGAPCPEGTTASRCGGAGMPCCCEPAPDPEYRCADAAACGGAPACDCLGEVCPDGLSCEASASESAFVCEELPAP